MQATAPQPRRPNPGEADPPSRGGPAGNPSPEENRQGPPAARRTRPLGRASSARSGRCSACEESGVSRSVTRTVAHARRSGLRLSDREIFALVHGLLIGGPFLLAFTGGVVALHGLRAENLTAEGIRERVAQLRIGATAMALLAWATVLTGTWVLLPWYREDSPDSPQSVLLSDPDTRLWHEFADVWKTHVAHRSRRRWKGSNAGQTAQRCVSCGAPQPRVPLHLSCPRPQAVARFGGSRLSRHSLSPICFRKVTRSYIRFSSTICPSCHLATV